MISKKISDLKDIKFEISTALQFEPSPLHVHTVPTGQGKRTPLPDTRRFVNLHQSQRYEFYFRFRDFLFDFGVGTTFLSALYFSMSHDN